MTPTWTITLLLALQGSGEDERSREADMAFAAFDANHDGHLSQEEFHAWVAADFFQSIDADGDRRLSSAEYGKALLFLGVTPDGWGDSRWSQKESLYSQSFPTGMPDGGGIDRVDAWRKLVEDRSGSWWSQALEQDPPIAPAGLQRAEFLAWRHSQAEERAAFARADARVARLRVEQAYFASPAERPQDLIREESLASFVASEMLDELDTDRTGTVDVREFCAPAAPAEVAAWIEDFLTLVRGRDRVLVVAEHYGQNQGVDTPLSHALANSDFGDRVAEHVGSLWKDLYEEGSPANAVALRRVRAFFRNQEAKEKAKQISGPGLVPDVGYVFGSRRPKEKGSTVPVLDVSQSALVLRIVKSLDNAGEKAEPALLGWQKVDGDRSTAIDGAVQLEWRPAGSWFRPRAGFQLDRVTTKDKERDLRRYLVGMDADWRHATPACPTVVESSHWAIGLLFEDDHREEVEKWTGSLSWQPVLDLAEVQSGRWTPAVNQVDWYYQPGLTLEVTDVTDAPAGKHVDEGSYVRAEMRGGLRLFRRLQLKTALEERVALRSGDDEHFYQETSLEWPLFDAKPIVLTFSFKSGEDSPSFEHVRRLAVGIGVKL